MKMARGKIPAVCLIGVSGFAEVHYRDLLRYAERGRVRLQAATVINRQEEWEKCEHLERMGCRVYSNYEEMLDTEEAEGGLCLIPTGIHLHRVMTIRALRAGWNVLVEKPAAATIQEVRAMEEAERETGRFVAVGFQTMYAPETRWMKRVILEGRLGEVEWIKCRGLWPRTDGYYQRNSWAGRMRHAGQWVLDSPFNNAFAHQLNMICFLAGTDPRSSARMRRVEAELYRVRPIEGPDTACLRMETEQGVRLFFGVTHACRTELDPEIVVVGSKGRLFWSFERTWLETSGGEREEHGCLREEVLRDAMLDGLLARLEDPGAFVCGLEIAERQTLCVNGAHESSSVHPLEGREVAHRGEGAGCLRYLPGIEGVMEEAFDRGALFSELGVPWAVRGKGIDLSGYERFPRTGVVAEPTLG